MLISTGLTEHQQDTWNLSSEMCSKFWRKCFRIPRKYVTSVGDPSLQPHYNVTPIHIVSTLSVRKRGLHVVKKCSFHRKSWCVELRIPICVVNFVHYLYRIPPVTSVPLTHWLMLLTLNNEDYTNLVVTKLGLCLT